METDLILRQCYDRRKDSKSADASTASDDDLQLLWIEEDGTQVFTLDKRINDETDSVVVLPVSKNETVFNESRVKNDENSVIIIPKKLNKKPLTVSNFNVIEKSSTEQKFNEKEVCEVSCQLCLQQFPRYEQLQEHISAHFDGFMHHEPLKDEFDDDRDKYFEICRFCLTRSESLAIHLEEKHMDEKFACVLCSEKYEEEEVFKQHLNDEHIYLECTICSKKFAQYLELQSHLSSIHFNGAFWCSPCSKAFERKYDFILHQRLHLGIRPFQCKHCDKKFVSINRCKRHEKSHTKQTICKYCDKSFLRTNDLKAHIKVEHCQDSTPIICQTCHKLFSNLSSYKLHAKRHELGFRFICNVCGKAYYANSELQRHLQLHSGIRKFPCTLCENSFMSQPELNRHLKYHKGEKLYKCDECGKSYYESGHLRIHERSHTGIKPFECKICSKRFVSGPKLMRHAKTHEQIKNQGKEIVKIEEVGDDELVEMNELETIMQDDNVFGIQIEDGNIVLMEGTDSIIPNELIYTSIQENVKIEIINQ